MPVHIPYVRHPPPGSSARTRRPLIEALISRSSRDEAIGGLENILSSYGKVVSVELLTTDSNDCIFLVDFEKVEDAITASFELNYLLFGHSTLVIRTAKNGKLAR